MEQYCWTVRHAELLVYPSLYYLLHPFTLYLGCLKTSDTDQSSASPVSKLDLLMVADDFSYEIALYLYDPPASSCFRDFFGRKKWTHQKFFSSLELRYWIKSTGFTWWNQHMGLTWRKTKWVDLDCPIDMTWHNTICHDTTQKDTKWNIFFNFLLKFFGKFFWTIFEKKNFFNFYLYLFVLWHVVFFTRHMCRVVSYRYGTTHLDSLSRPILSQRFESIFFSNKTLYFGFIVFRRINAWRLQDLASTSGRSYIALLIGKYFCLAYTRPLFASRTSP